MLEDVPLKNFVQDQIDYICTELGWVKDTAEGCWRFASGQVVAAASWNPFFREEDAWRLFTMWEPARQIHKMAGGMTVVIQMPTGDLISFGYGTGRYCGPAIYQVMAAAVGHYREADLAYKMMERKRQFRSERYEDSR